MYVDMDSDSGHANPYWSVPSQNFIKIHSDELLFSITANRRTEWI